MSSPQDSAAERLRERLDGQSDFAALLGGGAPKAVPQVSVPAPYLRLVLDEYAERGRKAAAFDALVEAVERADLECRKPQTVTGVRRGLHTLTCLEGYDDGMPCRPCALRAALASAEEALAPPNTEPALDALLED